MQLLVNGEATSVNDDCTIEQLLATLDMKGGRVAVEVNREIIPRSLHQTHKLNDNDTVEIVHAIGGG